MLKVAQLAFLLLVFSLAFMKDGRVVSGLLHLPAPEAQLLASPGRTT